MLDEGQLMEKAKRAREIADAIKAKLDVTLTPDTREGYLKDYWFERGKLEAYREVLKG